MIADGDRRLHVLTDFDRTLTKAFVNGQSIPSLISVLRDRNFLTPDYPAKAHALYAKYHPMEIDPDLSQGERRQAMEEWWTQHLDLLIASGLRLDDIQRAMKAGHVQLRDGVKEFFALLARHSIPIVIMSSSAIGTDSIALFLTNEGALTDNVHIISNDFDWDEHGRAISYHRPVLHSLNKAEKLVSQFPFYGEIQSRPNVILIGDNEGDVDMVTGFQHAALVKIGFLNEGVERLLPTYQALFDIVITNDGSLDPVNELLHDIIGQR